ncbi:MAG: phosphoribosylglycinamide formyltransferase [Candidatus Kapabacteria bacterium]|nr:phosphoribosylglycinamide formyltransferase [Candidatus Kapabacteria bacterium]
MSHGEPRRVAILGSGTGSNARALVEYSRGAAKSFTVELIISTRSDAGIVNVAREFNIPYVILQKNDWVLSLERGIDEAHCDILALAGFMRKLPTSTIEKLSGRVVNIHPALLPKFGGAGMYGIHVHTAVIKAGEHTTGATVHLVTDEYDEGAILGQDSIQILPGDSPESLQERVKRLEHELYPRVVDAFSREMGIRTRHA